MLFRAQVVRTVIVSAAAISIAACGDEDPEAESAVQALANQTPIISGTPSATVVENEFYEFTPTASDPDGDPIIFGIDGMPGWLDFDTSDGRLSGTPGSGDVGLHRGIVIWVSDGVSESLLPTLDIDVRPAASSNNRAPVISGVPAGNVATGDFYDFIPVASDADGDALSFSIENQPGWAAFDPQIGRLSGTPAAQAVGSYGNIIISVSDGIASTALSPFVIVVNPPPSQNTPPTISGQPAANVLTGSGYSFTPTADDLDGDALTFSVIALPGWAQFNVATGTLSGTPSQSDAGIDNGISILVSDGEATAALPSFSIEVIDPNSPPTINGNPDDTVVAGDAYSFSPSANDPDGDTLSFSITGRPAWANFNAASGVLSGNPAASDIGSYTNIRITVEDGSASSTLGPFSIEVITANPPPTINGSPPSQVLIGNSYSFVPSANDPDGDSLSFSVSGLPSWASFNAANGALTGTPSAGDVGTYNNISITVTDGAADATLGPFSIGVVATANGSATLSWTPPTQNTDGSPLTDLAGFVVYWGTAPGDYQNSVTLNNPGLTSYLVENLAQGMTHYFSTTALNSTGLESSFSNVASKTIP